MSIEHPWEKTLARKRSYIRKSEREKKENQNQPVLRKRDTSAVATHDTSWWSSRSIFFFFLIMSNDTLNRGSVFNQNHASPSPLPTVTYLKRRLQWHELNHIINMLSNTATMTGADKMLCHTHCRTFIRITTSEETKASPSCSYDLTAKQKDTRWRALRCNKLPQWRFMVKNQTVS